MCVCVCVCVCARARLRACVRACVCVCASFLFGFEGGMWDLIVIVPDRDLYLLMGL